MAEKEILSVELRAPRNEQRELDRELVCIFNGDEAGPRRMFEDLMEEVGKAALNIYRSSVPIRTRQLQGFIKLRSRNRVTKSITVSSELHTNSRTKDPIASDELADILEEGKHRVRPYRNYASYRRSRTNTGFPPFVPAGTGQGSPTADWAEKAFDAFNEWFDKGDY